MTPADREILTATETAVLRHLVGLQHPTTADVVARALERKQAGVTRALGGLDAKGLAELVAAGWQLTERGRMVGLRIAASHQRAPRSVP